MKRLRFYIQMLVVLIMSLSLYTTRCDNYDPEEYSSKTPVDFVYVNKSDYKINALLLDHRTDAYDTLLNNKTTINLEPGDSVTIVTDKPVDGSREIFKQYVVIFNDSDFVSCNPRSRRNPTSGWNADIPLYPISYKIYTDENERNHTVYEFTFTNDHYESACMTAYVYEKISTTERGERYFKDWKYYYDYQNSGTGVTIDSLVWSPGDYNSTMVPRRGNYHYYKYEDALIKCPKGWRIPTAEEFSSLIANHSQWGDDSRKYDPEQYTINGGYWFSGSKEYTVDAPAVYFPSHYLWSDNDLKSGLYWTATRCSDNLALAFRFDNAGNIGLVQKDESETYLLRCVKDYNLRKYYYGD